MHADEYRAHLTMILNAARVLESVPVADMLREIAHAHAVGPILDPTLYRSKHQAMDEDAEMLNAALPLHRLGKKLAALAAENGGRDA